MRKIFLIVVITFFASCKKVYTCRCENKGSSTFSSNTSTMHTTRSDANTTCQQKGIKEGWQTCELAEAK
jgi:hypothetical protein